MSMKYSTPIINFQDPSLDKEMINQQKDKPNLTKVKTPTIGATNIAVVNLNPLY